MATISFSLTEKVIVNPILTLRAPLPPKEKDQGVTWKESAWQLVQSEMISRIVAISASVFAVADAVIHFSTGVYKAASLIARKICFLPSRHNKSIVYAHFRQAIRFSAIALIGSAAGFVWPGIFKYFRYSPPPPTPFLGNISTRVSQLVTSVQNGKEKKPFTQLREFWRRCSLEEKHCLAQIFSLNSGNTFDGRPTAIFQTVRKELTSVVYQPISSLADRNIQWLSSQEISPPHSWESATIFDHSFFYHATSESALESILKSKKVEVRHEKAFRGAFVSTQPETGFGNCILAFYRNIERLSPLQHGFEVGSNYWAGFSQDIPVTASTLAYIILEERNYDKSQRLSDNCKAWTGRAIEVISLEEARHHLDTIQQQHMGIPAEWPSSRDSGGPFGQMVLRTLKARAAEAAVQVQQAAHAQQAKQYSRHRAAMAMPMAASM